MTYLLFAHNVNVQFGVKGKVVSFLLQIINVRNNYWTNLIKLLHTPAKYRSNIDLDFFYHFKMAAFRTALLPTFLKRCIFFMKYWKTVNLIEYSNGYLL